MEENNDYNPRWWTLEGDDVHQSLFGIIQFLKQNQGWRETLNLRNMRLYSDYKNLGLTSNTYAQNDNSYNNFNNRLTFNIIKSLCDTAYNRIAKSRPRPLFLTEGGNESKQRKAKKLSKFIEGIFYQQDAYKQFQRMFLDASVFGSGFVKVYRDQGNIRYERVFINELKVDEAEAINGSPRQLFQTRSVDVELLKSQFPDYADELEKASDILYEQKGYQRLSEQITVVEAWRLPSSKDSNDGRHVISVSNCVLLDEEWKYDHFPFVKLDWSDRLLGYWGYGIAESCTGIQYEINSLLQTIQLSMRLCSVPKVFVEVGSKIVPAHLNNEIGGIIFYSGTKPIYEPIQAVSPELFAQVERLVQRAYELTGISLLSAQSKKPSGLNSGVALREFNDIESERFSCLQQQYEEAIMTAAKYTIELAKEIDEEIDGGLEVTIASNKEMERIKWKEVDLDAESYVMKVYPTAALPGTPAGKLDKVVDLTQNGFLSREEAFSLLDFPDIEAATEQINADYEDIKMTIEQILDGKKYLPPEPYQNLELGTKEMQRAYLRARRDNISEDKMQKMRDWITQAQDLMGILNAPPPAPAPVPGLPLGGQVAPIAAPPAAPQGDLQPFPTVQ